MNLINVIIVQIVIATLVVANPLTLKQPLDNDVEFDQIIHMKNEEIGLNLSETTEDWQLVPDKNGNMQLVDVNREGIDPSFNAWRDVRFILFTRRNTIIGQPIAYNNISQLDNSNFNPAHRTRFIIHGWRSDDSAPLNNNIAESFLTLGEFNVFVIDWGVGALTINYVAARNRVPDVGHVTAQFIDFLSRRGLPFSAVSLIGHSLGAHVAGFAGKRVLNGRIPTIVGLDVAAPLFSFSNEDARLHFSDADYVQSIHTEIGLLGFDQPIGHSAFYPNWGRSQPGCGWSITGTCSHGRAHEFFTESIVNANAFWSTRCSGFAAISNQACPPAGSNQIMGGEPVNRGASGVYFLRTNSREPFGQGYLA